MRALSEAAGAIFVVLGVLIALTAAGILASALAGFGGVQPIRPFERQYGVSLPPLRRADLTPR